MIYDPVGELAGDGPDSTWSRWTWDVDDVQRSTRSQQNSRRIRKGIGDSSKRTQKEFVEEFMTSYLQVLLEDI